LSRTPDISKAIEATVARAVRSEVLGGMRRLEKQVEKLSEQIRRVGSSRTPAPTNGHVPHRPASKGRQLHGRYIGLLRHLPKKDQVRVRGIRHKQGVHAAIRAAEKAKRA